MSALFFFRLMDHVTMLNATLQSQQLPQGVGLGIQDVNAGMSGTITQSDRAADVAQGHGQVTAETTPAFTPALTNSGKMVHKQR
jgi:hypothetical protein